ncbi:MAG TPA: tetratricopeptide repeat protein [Sandaracinaceae bacterium LLY-WYZ-13_1]|nr:tetratricopeptide repeat protein [Sandaracinaceae bacterium LLY-WYZ-13_1]
MRPARNVGLRLGALAASVLWLTGCPSEPSDTPGEPASAEAADPSAAGDPGSTPEGPSVGTPDRLRGPAGARPVACDGSSNDPEQIALFLQGAERDLPAAIRGMESLAGAHPGSATARVKLGELLLRTRPPSAARAQRWFDRALALDAEGCALAPRDRWAALEGLALSHMMQGDYAPALGPLRRSLERWPDVPSTHYNLACALCQTGDVDGCARELGRVLAMDAPGPAFLADQRRPRAHYVRLARRDPDLAPLREDAARFEALLAR